MLAFEGALWVPIRWAGRLGLPWGHFLLAAAQEWLAASPKASGLDLGWISFPHIPLPGAGWTPLAPPSSSPGPCTKFPFFSLFFPFSQRPGVGISPLSLFPPPLRGQGSHPFRVPAAGMSQPCRHGAHPQPGFWDGFAAFRVIPSPEQWETLLNFRVCCSLPTHH